MDKPSAETILIVDDSPDTQEIIRRHLKTQGFQIFTASDVNTAIKILENQVVDLIVTDIKMPKYSGYDLIKYVRDHFKDIEIVVITGYPSIEGAIKAVKSGAEEYLAKPFTKKELFGVIEKARQKLLMRKTMKSAFQKIPSASYGILGKSKEMNTVFRAIEKAAVTPVTVIVSGESGTGKELVARAIHYTSSRASAPFVPINCGGIPESLLESELFGYVKGAFTGALDSRPGFFQTAEGGSIFLDEISETSPSMQVKLLRVLQEKEICMVGSRQPQKVDVRIIAATNKDILSLVKSEHFREDLYYRLNIINIEIPPLRKRKSDILILIKYFSEKYSQIINQPVPQFSDRALTYLCNYNWPGNVRELENVVNRMVIMREKGTIHTSDLPPQVRSTINNKPLMDKSLKDVETEHIKFVLESLKGNKTKAAKILGIDRKTLREKLKQGDAKKTG